jgi:ATP/maltotriose-dependent transcriptional regulator MalT
MKLPRADGRELLERATRIAIEQDLPDDAARAMTNLAWPMLDQHDLDLAGPMLDAAIAYTSEHDLVGMELYQRAALTRLWLARGRWDEAASTNERLLEMASANNHTRIVALTVLGQVETRRGNDATPLLDEALALAIPTGHVMRLGPVRAARAEAAWLAGDPELALAEAHPEYERAIASQDEWTAGMLALWLHRCGETRLDTATLPAPFALEIGGRGREAAAFWHQRGMPLEEARALASTGEEAALLEALALVDRLGARPDAARIVRALRHAGATSIPRGPRAETRANPAGLTSREVEVLELLVRGCTNREIADSLYLSPRTVGHHVSAILGKLEITSRADAAARAAELDLLAG